MKLLIILICLLMVGICNSQELNLGESEVLWQPDTVHFEVEKLVLDCHGIKLTFRTEFLYLEPIKRIEFYIQSSSKTVVFIKEESKQQ